VISAATTQISGTPDPLYTCVDTVRLWIGDIIRYKPEVETVPQNGSTTNSATETDIDAISEPVPTFWGKVFTGVCVDFARHFLHPEIPRWRTYTGSGYNFATENDTKVISEAAAMSGHARSTSTSINIVRLETINTIMCKLEVETVPKTGSTN